MEEDKIIKGILEKSTEFKAPVDFSEGVLKAWRIQDNKLPAKPHLIPIWTWFLLVPLFATIFGWGIRELSSVPADSVVATGMQKGLQLIEYLILGYGNIIFSAVIVFILVISLNTLIIKRRLQHIGS